MKSRLFTRHLFITVLSVCIIHIAKAQDTLAHWGFNEGAGSLVQESVSKSNFTIQSNWPVVEWVPGINTSAMRTDGYSVWAAGTLPGTLPSGTITMYAWVAPEVYPVADAAVWAQFDNATNLGAWMGMDKYGRLKVAFNKSGILLSYNSIASLTHYAWNYLVVTINAQAGSITGYLNSVKVIDETFAAGSINWPSAKTTSIGNLPNGQMNGLYPTSTMNAIIDEVTLLNTPIDQNTIIQLYNQNKPAAYPDMKTPASRFATDFLRPKYHPIPNSNWCNESHGLIYDNGQYHLFYQKNGNGSYLFQQNWGHLVSTDLVNWHEISPALWPTPGWDNYGIWSGHAVKDSNDNPVIFFTGVDGVKAGIGSATPTTDSLLTWQKNAANPLIPAAPSSYPNKDFRDPYLFKENGFWYMIVGSGLQTPNVGTVFLYKSTNLTNWQFIKPMYSGDPLYASSGIFWEMPVFWNFGSKHVLEVNRVPQAGIPAKSLYWAGNFTNESFTPDNPSPKNLELINWLLSPTVNTNTEGRVTAIGIIPDLIPSSEQYKRGYANLFSLPRVWTLQNDSIMQSPHPNTAKLRGDSSSFSDVNITTNGSQFLSSTHGFQLEISADITGGKAQQAGLIIGKNADNSEYTRIYYDYQYGEVIIDRTHSSTNPATPGDVATATVSLSPNLPINWHVFIDGSVIEVFINNKYAFASRYYPVSANSNGVDLFATGNPATANVKVWNMNSSTVLPLTWLSFNAMQIGKDVQLQWQVANEINIDHYEVERSSDGNYFQTVAVQKSANSSTLFSYTYLDKLPVDGNNYYRIKEVDRDGETSYSVIKQITITEVNHTGLILLLQNPAKNTITLKVLTDMPEAGIVLYDAGSKKVYAHKTENTAKNAVITIPVQGCKPGIYLLTVSADGKKETYKVLIQ